LHFYFIIFLSFLFLNCFALTSDDAVTVAIEAQEKQVQEDNASKVITTKDDVARLLHLFKEPAAQ